MNTALIRQLNISRIFHALREHPGSSQRELGAITGIDKATISAVVGQLGNRGLVERRTKRNEGRVGRPEIAIRISEEAGIFIGTRLEPTTIRAIATTLDARVLRTAQCAGSTDVAEATDRLRELVHALLDACGRPPKDVRGLGVGVPGLMDKHGNLTLAPNLGWRNVPIREELERAFAFPVYVDNDTKAAALAEKLFGACRDTRHFIFITGHAGVGGGLYLDGLLYRGTNGYAGELGHMKIVSGGRQCSCGARGCLEAYVSEVSILQRLAEAGIHLDDVWQVAERAEARDRVVMDVLEGTGSYLGLAIANLMNLMNPELVVLGGNLAVVAPYTLPAAKRAWLENTLPDVETGTDVIISPLGAESVPMGSIALAMEGFLSLPVWLAADRLRH